MAYTYDVTETDPILLEEERKRRRKKRAETLGLTEEELDVAEPAPEEKPPEPPPTPKPPVVEGEPGAEFILQGRKAPEFPPETFKPPQAPRDELPALLERVFPEKFKPGETSYGYTKEQLVPVVTDQLRTAMQADFKAFQYDAYRRVGQDEGEKLLRALGANERAILQGYNANMQEQRIVNTIRSVLPDVSTFDQFQELIDTDRKAFARKVLDGGITPEKQRLLDLMNTNEQQIKGLLLDRIVAEVDGVRKQVVRDDDNQVYDERGQWLGWYDWGTKAVFNPYKETTLFGKAKASITAGVGDLLSTAGGAARWLGQEDIGATLSAKGKELQQFGQPSGAEFQPSDILDPEFYATKVARTIPFAVSLAPVAVGSFYAGSALAAGAGLGALGTMLVASLGSGALNRAAEGALEAGSQYDDAIARGKTEAEAKKEADEVFTNNMKLAGMDAWQIAIALAPTPKWVPKALVNSGLAKVARVGGKMVIVGLTEGGEEVYQQMVQRHAAGEEWRLDPVDKEVFAIGAVMGLGMGLGGDVVQSIVNKAKTQMPTDLKAIFDGALDGGKTELQALNEVAKTPEGQSLIQKLINEERGEAEIGPRGKPEGEVPKAPEVQAAKEPWQMTREEFITTHAAPNATNIEISRIGANHAKAIIERLDNGYSVPESIMKDYPNLRGLATTKREWQLTKAEYEAQFPTGEITLTPFAIDDAIANPTKLINFLKDKTVDGETIGIRGIYKQELGKKRLRASYVVSERGKREGRLGGTSATTLVNNIDNIAGQIKENLSQFSERIKKWGDQEFFAIVKGKPDVHGMVDDPGETVIRNAEVLAYIPRGAHRQSIAKALSEGKPVPPEVLKDYPDLAKAVPKAEVKPTTPIPETTEVFHGTSIKNAQALLKQQQFDLSKLGTGADIRFKKGTAGVFGIGQKPGFFGEGAYFTSKPELAKIYAEARPSGKGKILKANIEGKIFDASNKSVVMDDLREYWIKRVAESRENKRLSPMSDNQLRVAFDAEVGEWQSGYIQAVNEYAKAKGFIGTKFNDSEIVIWDKKAIKNITDIEAPSTVKPTTTPTAAISGQGVEAAGVKEALKPEFEVKQVPGEPEAGMQAGLFGEQKVVRPKGKGVVTQIEMDDQAKLAAYELSQKQAEVEGLRETLASDPAAKLTDLIARGKMAGEVNNIGVKKLADLTGKTEWKSAFIDKANNKVVRWEDALDELASERGFADAESLKEAIEKAAEMKARIKTLEGDIAIGQENLGAQLKAAKPPAAEVPPAKPPEPPEAAVTPTPEPKPTPVQRVREFYKAKIADLEATTRDKIASLKDWAKYTVSERDRVKNILTDYVQANLPLEERGKLLDAVKNVTNQAELDEVIARVDRLGEVTEQKRLRGEIKKELAKTKPKKVEGILKGKYTAEFQDWLDVVRQNVGMDRDEARARIAEVIQQHAENKISEEAMQEQIAVLSLAGIDGMSSAELQEVLTDIRDMKTIGRTLNQANQEKLKADIATIKEKAVNEVTGGKGLKPGTGVLDARELEAKTNFVGKLTDSQLAFGNLLDEISKLSGTQPYQSTLSKFERTVQEARNKENSGRKLYQKAIIQDFAKIYSLKDSAHINAKLNQLENEKVDLGTFRVVIDGKAQQIHMVKTKAQIIQHYLWQQDPTLTDTYKEGMHWTYEINNAMANALNDQDVAFADSISQFYRDYYPSIDQVYKELYGVHLPNNPNYSPLLRDFDTAQPENVMLYKDLAHYASVLNGSLKSRVKNILPLHDTSVLANLINHVEQMEHFKAWSMPMRTMRRVFGDKAVRTAIQQYHGRPVMKKIDHYLDLFARGGVDRMQIIRGLDKLRGNFATAVLGLKPHIAIQQIPTILGYTTEMPIGDFFAGVGDFWKNPIRNYQWILKNSPYIQNRYEAGFERDIRTATTKKALTEWSGKGSFTEKVYALIEGGDKLGVIPGWWAKYKSGLKHGLSEQEAMIEADLATNRTQNTSDIETLSSLQNGGSFMKLLTMFQNQPNKYFRIMADNARNFKYGRGSKEKAISNILMVAVVLPTLYAIIANAFRVRKDELLRAAVFSPVNSLLVFGQMAQAIEGWIAGDTFGYRASPVLDSIQEIQNAISKARKLVAAGQDPYKDISMDDVVALTEFVAKAGGQLTGLPTPYLVNVERALRGTEGKRDLRELVFSRWALRDEEEEEGTIEIEGKLGQTIEYSQKQLDAMAKAGQKVTPKVYDMKALDSDIKDKMSKVLPTEITEKNGYSPMAVAWAQKEIARGQSGILPNIKLKDYFKEDYDDFSPRQYVEQYQSSLRIKSLQELKEYASVYPRYYLGNLTERQLEAMEKYATLSKAEQEKFLESHPELLLNPRQEWLKSHPEDNARLAVWGDAKVLTQAAYDAAQKMITDLDIPDSAIEGIMAKEFTKPFFELQETTEKFGDNSWESQLIKAQNPKLTAWMKLTVPTTPIKSLELKVKNAETQRAYDALSDKESGSYLSDVKDPKTGKSPRDLAQEKMRKENAGWVDDLRRIEAIESDGEKVAEKFVEYGKVADKFGPSSAEARLFRIDNGDLDTWGTSRKNGWEALDRNKVAVWRLDAKYRDQDKDYQLILDQYADVKRQTEATRNYLDKNPAYRADRWRRDALSVGATPEMAESYRGYAEIVHKYGAASAEAKLHRIDNPALEVFGHSDKAFKWLPLSTENIPVLRINAQYRKQDEAYEAIKFPGDDRKQAAEREKYLKANPQYRVARIQRGGYELGLRDVKPWTEYNQLPEYGFWRERYRRDNPDFDKSVLAAQKAKGQTPWMPVTTKVPAVQYDQLYQQYKAKFDAYENVEGNDDQRRQVRERMLKADPKFTEARITRNAYGLLIGNEKYVPEYVNYYKILAANLPLDNYEDDWYLMEHQAFYNTMLKALDWKTRDFSKVPTRPVWQKYQQFLGLVEGKPRDDFRFANPDLEAWLVKKFGYKPITEKKRRAELSSSERLAEEVQKRQKRLAGIGAR